MYIVVLTVFYSERGLFRKIFRNLFFDIFINIFGIIC